MPPSLRERHITAFARFIETGHGSMLGRRLELTGMRADGSEFPVELALSQVEGEPFLICGALRDISAAKQAESHLRELADEQAALRRVATLVARESSPQQLFAVVAEQVARIIDVPLVRLVRYESDGSAVELIGGWGESVDPLAIGTRWQLDGARRARVRLAERPTCAARRLHGRTGTGRRRRAAGGDAFGGREPHHCRRSPLGRHSRPLAAPGAAPREHGGAARRLHRA